MVGCETISELSSKEWLGANQSVTSLVVSLERAYHRRRSVVANMREIVKYMHEIVQNDTSESDDTWDGDHDFSFDMTEGNSSLKTATSYSPSTESSSSGRTSKDHLQNVFLEDRHSLSKTPGFERRKIEGDETLSVMGRISSSISTNSTSSFSVISYRGRRNSRSSGKIAYLDEEFPVDPKGDIFKVCIEKSSKSRRLQVDAYTNGCGFPLETTTSRPNDWMTTTKVAGDDHFLECPFELQSSSAMALSETISGFPDDDSAENQIPWASFRQQDQALPVVDWTPGSLACESNVSPSSAPL